VNKRHALLLALAVLVAGSVLRLAYLDSDPDYYVWVGYITDEGRWVGHARDLALFGRIVNTHWLPLLHLFLAPLFQAISYAVFELLGVSIWSARLPTALAGSVILGLFWLMLRRVVTAPALLVGLLLLALDVDLIELSRISVPETAAMLAQLAVYAVVTTRRPTTTRMLAAGLLLAAAAAIKATTLPAAIIFSVIVLCQPIGAADRRQRVRHLLMLWAGFLSPLLVLVSFVMVCCPDRIWAVASNISLLDPFLPEPPSLYSIVSFSFGGSFAPTINIWAVGVCLSLVAWLARPRDVVNPGVRQHFVTSAIWCGLYAPIMLNLDYFHLLIPLAINIASGVSLAATASQTTLGSTMAGRPRGRRLLLLALVTLPTAVLWAPALAGVAAHTGIDIERLRVQLACVLIAGLLTAWAVWRAGLGPGAPRIFFIFPIVAIIGWMVCLRTGLDGGRFWPGRGGSPVAWWSVGLPVTAVFATTVASIGRRWSLERWSGFIPAAVLCYSALGVLRIVPAYVAPHYSIKQVSQDLGFSLANSPSLIASANAEGLFNGNALPYRTVVGRTWPTYRPDTIVIVFVFDDPEELLSREYRLAATYELYTSAEARRPAVVRVYRREAPGGDGTGTSVERDGPPTDRATLLASAGTASSRPRPPVVRRSFPDYGPHKEYVRSRLVLLQARLDVDGVRPDVHGLEVVQPPALPGLVLRLPTGLQRRDRRCRQRRPRPQQPPQGQIEVAVGQPVQVQLGQEPAHFLGAAAGHGTGEG